MFHLGKKTRMWRSVLNPKSSWLSKEIISYALFYGLVFMDLLLFNIPDVIIIFWGFTLLISIDMLYALATWRWPLQIHSAQTIFIGITIYSVLTNSYYLLAFILAFRLTIYIYKTYKNKEKNLILPILRVIIPIISFGFLLQLQHVLFVVLIVTADILDRIEFYNELNVPDPKDEFIIKKVLIL